MKCYQLIAISIVAVFVISTCIPSIDAEENGDMLLVDFGNGQVCWTEVTGAGSYGDIIVSSAESVGLNANFSSGELTIDGITKTSVTGYETVNTSWKLYLWNEGWKYQGMELSSSYSGGTFAIGFYPDASEDNIICPVSTPEYKTVWTQFGGSSKSYNTSDSYGLLDPVLPVEWHITYSTGYVDSGLIVAENLLYHTTGGAWGAGGENADPWIYCLDRFTGDIVWKYHGTYGAGYEVTTPVIVGNMLIVTMTCGDVLCFDRFSGDMLHQINVGFNPPMNDEGTILWDSETFVTGAATPVYDSGALYFGTADGKIYCYSISYFEGFKEIWCYDPPDTYSGSEYTGTKGTFYFHAPTIANIEGRNVLFIGNYGGHLFAIDCQTGKELWSKHAVDMSDSNIPKPGMPGSAATTTVSRDGSTLLVTCTDGGMTTSSGYILALDPLTGEGKNGEDYLWKINALMTTPVCSEDGFYTYMSASSKGDEYVCTADGTEVTIDNSICKFDWNGNLIWMCSYNMYVKSPLTLADGVLYAMEYSAGGTDGGGGHLSAVSAEDGTILWKILVQPFSEDSYSMAQATVVDGKVYVANDYGAVYCISNIAGPSSEGSEINTLETAGFDHWSWYVLIAMIIATLVAFVLFYRGA